MFEQTFIAHTPVAARGWTLVASTAGQIGLIAGLALVPLLQPDLLPRSALASILTTPTLPPAKAPGPPPRELGRAAGPRRNVVRETVFTAPPAIPLRVAMIDTLDEAPVNSAPDGVVGVPPGLGNTPHEHAFTLTPPPARTEPTPAPKAVPPPAPVTRIQVGGVVQEGMLVHRVIPEYPRLAVQNRLEGQVVFHALIGRDGVIAALRVVSGHPVFVQAATGAVRQWRYRPTLLNGDPCEVETSITVTFALRR